MSIGTSTDGRPVNSSGVQARVARVWWLSPVTVTLILTPVAVLSAGLPSDDTFRSLWRTPKTIDGSICLLLLAGGLAVALGASIVMAARPVRPSPNRWPSLRTGQRVLLEKASTLTFALTLIGYVAFLIVGMRAGIGISEITNALAGEGVYDGTIKGMLGTVPGVTTLTQVGLLSVVISSLLLADAPSWKQRIRLTVVFVLALPRAFLLTERLALLELAVPTIVVFALRMARTRRGGIAAGAIPILALPVVATVFAAFEHSRSWVFFRDQTNANYAEFALSRLIGYYSTSLNNGALELLYNSLPGRWPFETMAAFWTAPGIGQLGLYRILNGQENSERYLDILTQYGNPEFNNSSGLAAAFVDLGTVGGLCYLLAAGMILGLLYRAFQEAKLIGLLLYPMLFLGIVELPRYLAWSQGRIFPSLLGAVILAVVFDRKSSPRTELVLA